MPCAPIFGARFGLFGCRIRAQYRALARTRIPALDPRGASAGRRHLQRVVEARRRAQSDPRRTAREVLQRDTKYLRVVPPCSIVPLAVEHFAGDLVLISQRPTFSPTHRKGVIGICAPVDHPDDELIGVGIVMNATKVIRTRRLQSERGKNCTHNCPGGKAHGEHVTPTPGAWGSHSHA